MPHQGPARGGDPVSSTGAAVSLSLSIKSNPARKFSLMGPLRDSVFSSMPDQEIVDHGAHV
jgi:hypothetical protein